MKNKKFARREFMGKAGIAGVAAVAASSLPKPALANKKVEMTIVSTWGRDFPGLGTGAQRLSKRIQEVSGGEITTKYFAAGEKVGAFAKRLQMPCNAKGLKCKLLSHEP